MNRNLSEIVFVLDRSGSMGDCAQAAISGFNEFLRDQREQAGEARISLVLFDDQYETPYCSIPIGEATDLDARTFVPRGSTALLDAIGRAIDELGARLAAAPEPRRPGLVVVAILTDGLENASRQFSWRDIADRINHQRDVYNWQFVFLGANQDAIATASQLRISAQMSSNFMADGSGTAAGFRSSGRKLRSMRAQASGGELSAKEEADLHAPLSELQQDEDEKERGE